MTTPLMQRLFRRPKVQTVMSHRIQEPRPTLWAAWWLMLYLGVPVVLLGTLLDGVIQGLTGYCTGFWCFL